MSVDLPRLPLTGERVSAAQMRQLINAVRKNTPIAGNGVRITRSMGGTVISAEPAGKGSSVLHRYFPFECEWRKKMNSDGTSVDFEGWAWYIPTGRTLRVNGEEVEWQHVEEEGNWKWFSSADTEGGSDYDLVYCQVELSDGKYTANMCPVDGKFYNSEADYLIPVCDIKHEKNSSGDTIERSVKQWAIGTMVIGGEGMADKGTFRIEVDENNVRVMNHCIFSREQFPISMGSIAIDSTWYGNFIWVEVSGSDSFPHINYGSFGAMQRAAEYDDYSIVPLYQFGSDGEVIIDLRTMPQMIEWQSVDWSV